MSYSLNSPASTYLKRAETHMNNYNPAVIRLENITKRFPGVVALEHINLAIQPGEIHAIIGENGAGKSTLMNLLAGELQPDEGSIYINEKAQVISDPAVSQALGISVVFQELALCPNLNISENISLWKAGRGPRFSILNRKEFDQTALEVLGSLGLDDINLKQPVGQLTVARQQMVEIAKSISTHARVLILDEPNSALSQEESEHLFKVVRQLKENGVTVLYISHHLDEVLSLADRITVLRDGKLVETIQATDATVSNLITRMVGRDIITVPREFSENSGEPSLSINGLSSAGCLESVSFFVRAGEFVGIAGLPDSHKDELVECLFGLRPVSGGEIRIHDRPIKVTDPTTAISEGMYLIPADRRGSGAFLTMSVQDNVVASNLKSVSNSGILHQKNITTAGEKFTKELDIRISSLKQLMATLSGGNQQKVILARGLATKPSVLVLPEPTRGIDVGAKAEIYKILQKLAEQGSAILIISSELPELISQCNRILVMHNGQVSGVFTHAEATEEDILACAMGHATHL